MKRLDPRIAGGILIAGFGALLLLQELGGLGGILGLLCGLLFSASGLVFLYIFVGNRDRWWVPIPGFVLLGLGILMILLRYVPAFANTYGGSLYLGSVSLGFWMVYFARGDHWWAVIPGGVILTLAAIPVLEQVLRPEILGGVFFLGVAVTFFLVSLLPSQERRRRWALIPAGIAALLAAITLVFVVPSLRILWPVAVILVGVAMLLLVVLPRRSRRNE